MIPAGDQAHLRELVASIASAAIEAVDPERAVARHLRLLAGGVEVAGRQWRVGPGDLRVLAVGKAAAGMARAAVRILAPLRPTGLTIVPVGTVAGPEPFVNVEAEHPVPGLGSERAARRAGALLDEAQAGDLVLVLLSGGASSLLADHDASLPVAAVARTTELLIAAGARIDEINVVRKHLGTLKGGRAALRARPARVAALTISDVVGSDPATIGSGLVAADPSTYQAAVAILKRHGLIGRVPAEVRLLLKSGVEGGIEETPSIGDPRLSGVVNTVIADNATATAAAVARARQLGLSARELTRPTAGPARAAGERLGRLARRLHRLRLRGRVCCLVAGGETVVEVRGSGTGGRNQELVAAAAAQLDGLETVCLCSLGTDGVDGPTTAAGALVTGATMARIRQAGLDLYAVLDDNDSYRLFDSLGDLVVTGPTGTNVMDLQILLLGER